MTIQATWKPSQGNSICQLTNGTAEWQADLDASAGGDTRYPNPHDLLDSALAACTTLTLQLYAKRKGYAVTDIQVSVAHEEANGTYTMRREVRVSGDLSPQILEDLLRVANRCPVHKTLSGQLSIQTSIA
ncbi:OsmC family protein [Cupriavidus neocaledonicus]|uniref:Hydroperoxide resistance protein, OsmC-like protein n=1 Tax=Cupriavidus neocaledonicus TaxID=1040979 RepID=A0A375HSF5_9BURK|nr:OsmC family protein [Cupriavidus neocaledonicus]SOZ38049.1 putative hydroperoxide resistance protein, OsmC-like protein [Cupriavidus neocaledonicus]SPD61099.1 Osmotically inducible protein C [Cupriavidus neocaledonicus]